MLGNGFFLEIEWITNLGKPQKLEELFSRKL
jgi:hypothetical protein